MVRGLALRTIGAPDQQGKFQIKGLPAGDYLAVSHSITSRTGSWNDPEYLESIRRYGQRISLSEAESQTVQ